MKWKFRVLYKDTPENNQRHSEGFEDIECDGMRQSEDTVVFLTATNTVDQRGNVVHEVFLVLHWSDLIEIRRIELMNGDPRLVKDA